MKVQSFRAVTAKEEMPGVTLRLVISAEDGAPNFVMRVFEVEPGKSTPWHSHDWEHEVFVLAGQGEAVSSDGKTALKADDVVFVAPNEQHQFVNTGSDIFRFICCIPHVTQTP
jgi:quercetin dioxygenase-like cupin family protein